MIRSRMKGTVACIIPTLILAGGILCGCEPPDTNNITPQTVQKANEDRIRHIDNDPTLDPKTKEKMKAMMGLSSNGQGGRRGPPAGAGR